MGPRGRSTLAKGEHALCRWMGGLVLGVAVLVLTVAAAAQTGAPANLGQPFQAADRNRDGHVDREEFHGWMVEVFYFHDKGRKGHLTLDELKGVGMSTETFAIASRGDGRLSLAEFLNATFLDFAAADADGSGALTLAELDVYVRRKSP